MSSFDYLIVGAGFAGAVCAERLASAGKRVLLIDKRDHIGGNAYDYYDEHGILCHKYGAHIFHTNSQRVWEYLSQFTAWRPYEHRVLACVETTRVSGVRGVCGLTPRFVTSSELLPVPINRTTLAAFGGDLEAAKHALYVPYTRKQWGCEPEELDPSVLARVKVRDSDDDRYFTDTYQAMPKDGYSALFQRMLAHENIHVLLKTDYSTVHSWFVDTWCEGSSPWPQVVYTGPIDEYFGYQFGKLPYRSAEFEHVTFDDVVQPEAAVINYPNSEIPYTREIDFRQLTGQKHHKRTVAYEYPQAEGEPFWPVPKHANHLLYEHYRALAAQTHGVYFVGRLATYKYLDMDGAVAQALKLTDRLLTGAP